MTLPPWFERAIEAIDAANARDPNVEVVDGRSVPKELAYSLRMSAWLARLEPEASMALRLAVRAQHIERWMVPRSTYAEGKKGYKLWRFELGKRHAERAAQLLREVGCEPSVAERVASLVRKEHLRSDAETQTLEDVACLVFLESYFHEFSRKHDEAKVIDILRKTWSKLTPRGQRAALALEMPAEARALVDRALTP